ncbi:hypothetical protein [Terrihabitans rhizophilus]|uniref:ABC transporter permease n=1 Tax=Terrihabitans rhizophilus TaxID=3092662 RepID=A0ABU4RNM6_9HYPH|nr:hypothetical protein [Terrihabitans sp. PJ23]MDX6806438.1 hypothetical protein [Terrihabitans sp. PJ23]
MAYLRNLISRMVAFFKAHPNTLISVALLIIREGIIPIIFGDRL